MSIKDAQDRLRHIAVNLERKEGLSAEDGHFLSNALFRIADGEDAKQALNVKAKRGERTSKAAQLHKRESDNTKAFALGWIAAAKASKADHGLGLTLEQAIGIIGKEHNPHKSFGLTEETLRTYWNRNPEKRNVIFEKMD